MSLPRVGIGLQEIGTIITCPCLWHRIESMYGIKTWMGDDGRDDEAIEAFQGVLNIRMTKPEGDDYRQFEAEVIGALNNSEDNNGTRYDSSTLLVNILNMLLLLYNLVYQLSTEVLWIFSNHILI